MNNNFYQQGYGYMYDNKPTKEAMFNNPLTDEQRKLLQNGESFTLALTQEEVARAYCTHRYPDKKEFALVPLNDGSGRFKCAICGTIIDPDAVTSEEYVRDVIERYVNVMEVTKLLGIDLSNNVIQQMFVAIPFAKKVPQLFKIASDQMNQYSGGINTRYADANGDFNIRSMYNGLSGGWGVSAFGAAPMMGGMMTPPVYNNMAVSGVPGTGIPPVNPFYNTAPNPYAYSMPPAGGVAPNVNPEMARMEEERKRREEEAAAQNNTAAAMPPANPNGLVTGQVNYSI